MSRCLMVLCLLLVVAPWVAAQDPTEVDPDRYQVVFENDQVRVVRITYGPGEKSVMHYHPDGVAVFFTDNAVRMTLPDGCTEDMEVKAGEAIWTPAGHHRPENLRDQSFELILVELKGSNGSD